MANQNTQAQSKETDVEENVEVDITEEDLASENQVEGGNQSQQTQQPTQTQPQAQQPQSSAGNPQLSQQELLKNPAVKKLVEDARSQEKTKLYNTIHNKEEEIEALNGQITELEQELEDKEAEIEEMENENLTEVEKLKKEITELKTQYETDKKEQELKRQQAELQAYKEKKLREAREAGHGLVTAVVGGDSKDEIDESIIEAKQEYERIQNEVAEKEKQANPPVQDTPSVTNPASSNESTLTAEDVKNMSVEEYKKNRDKIRRLVQQGELG